MPGICCLPFRPWAMRQWTRSQRRHVCRLKAVIILIPTLPAVVISVGGPRYEGAPLAVNGDRGRNGPLGPVPVTGSNSSGVVGLSRRAPVGGSGSGGVVGLPRHDPIAGSGSGPLAVSGRLHGGCGLCTEPPGLFN